MFMSTFEEDQVTSSGADEVMPKQSLEVFHNRASMLFARLGHNALRLHPKVMSRHEQYSSDSYSVFSFIDPTQMFSELGVGHASYRGLDKYMLFRTDYLPSNNDLMTQTSPITLPGYRQQYNIAQRPDGSMYGTATRNMVNVPPYADNIRGFTLTEHQSYIGAVDVFFDISVSDARNISDIIAIANTAGL